MDRNELAARCLVALLSNPGRVGHGSNVVDAVTCADALIARLARPVATTKARPEIDREREAFRAWARTAVDPWDAEDAWLARAALDGSAP